MTDQTKSSPQEDLAKLRRNPNAMKAWQTAMQCLNSGQHTSALVIYRDLVQNFPAVPQLWAESGIAAAGELDFAQADHAFQRALQLAPPDANFLVSIGLQYFYMRRLDQALACLQRAVAADPASANARLTMATWQERSRRLDDAMESVDACLARHPRIPQALYLKAFILHRQSQEAEAETLLRDLLKSEPPLNADMRANTCYLLGAVLDALGQYSEALDFLAQGKAARAQIHDTAKLSNIFDNVDQRRREVVAALTPDIIQRWRNQGAATPLPHPLVLLAGAPRSGTTLVEQILGAHPGILGFDEQPSFAKEVLAPLHAPPPDARITLDSLDGASVEKRLQLISRYFKSMLRENAGSPAGRLFLDKNPSTTAWLHVWLRIFPQSKIIIALRDPRDVIISSYFQNMPPAWAAVSFATLERTARFYADCMDIWLRMRDLGGFDWIETRYEDVVNNLESEGRRVTQFLGLPWDAGQAKYYESARGKFVHAPTYDEVTKPVYTTAIRRWEHYAAALEPLQPALAKYCQIFGYS